jgi:hypothetical protein
MHDLEAKGAPVAALPQNPSKGPWAYGLHPPAAAAVEGENVIRDLGLDDGFTRVMQELSAEGLTKVLYVLALGWPTVAGELMLREMSPVAAQIMTQKLEEAEQTFSALELEARVTEQGDPRKGGGCKDQAETGEGPSESQFLEIFGKSEAQAAGGLKEDHALANASDGKLGVRQRGEKCSSSTEKDQHKQQTGLTCTKDSMLAGRQNEGATGTHDLVDKVCLLPYASREDFYGKLYGCVEDPGELFQLMLQGGELLAAVVKKRIVEGCGLL